MNQTSKRPAVFLDRDGTINEEMGYINHLSRFRLLPEAAPAIRLLNDAGLMVVVVTNQSGAARGYFPATLVDEVHRHLQDLLAQAGARVDAIYTCRHAPDAGCPCRKPRPGLILEAARDLSLDLNRSYLIGDRYKDIETAANAGVQGFWSSPATAWGSTSIFTPNHSPSRCTWPGTSWKPWTSSWLRLSGSNILKYAKLFLGSAMP